MAKRACIGDAKNAERIITGYSDADLLFGIEAHADPKWWKRDDVQRTNQAYLRRWGSQLRREARKRGLL